MTAISLEARIGGTFRFALENGAVIVGTYLDIVPPERLAFTWSVEALDDRATVVTLDFLDQGSVTEVVLTHEGLSTPEMRALVGSGWPTMLNILAAILEADAQVN